MIAVDARADLNAGREAFDRGDYDTAEQEWRTAAERGNAEGEFGLGEVYEQGRGDYKRAELWYEKAARHGSIEARYRLALIALAGNRDAPPDPVKAYRWTVLGADPKDEWGLLADDLRRLLQQHISAGEQREGEKEADSWRDAGKPKPTAVAVVAPPPAITAPIAPAVGPAPKGPNSPGGPNGCTPPGWPGPPLPCTDRPLPGIPGTAGPLPAPSFDTPGGPPSAEAQKQLADVLKRIDCALLHSTNDARGYPVISGTVPDEAEKAKLIQASSRLIPEGRPEVNVDIMPPPLCRSFVEFDSMRATSLAASGLSARLASGAAVLHEGDPIRIEVKAGDYPAYLRIDYFSLDGQVLHLLPGEGLRTIALPAGAKQPFGPWYAGGAPFGTEFIAVVATPRALDLGNRRSPEEASGYIAALERALRAQRADGQPNLLATVLVHTAAR